ncbi:HlyD family type I secretion periplasmic adaptor subunit [Reyranella sp.]|uniref:HlyD family type I secretion periplasmic adaptor subunit n=1 Tax=Reyranella sp. TaxID=1929291 RepID=UPI0037840967
MNAGIPQVRLDKDAVPPRNAVRPLVLAGVVILIVFGGIGAWSATAPIDSAVVAPGMIAVESDRRSVQHLEGGIVAEVLVKEGSVVKQGQLLMRLDETRTRAQEEVARGERYTQLAAEARLTAERDEQKAISFPEDLLARKSDKKVGEILKLAEAQFQTRNAAIKGQRQILQQRIVQLEEQIEGFRALQKSKARQGELIDEEMRMIEDLVKKGHVTRQRYLALQREASRLDGEAADHIASIAKAQQTIGETKLQILQLDNDRAQEITKELREVQAKLFEATERLGMLEDQSRRLEITAPVDGTVINLAYVTVGGVVPPGATILAIVPSNEKIVAQAQVSPADIDSVHPGQSVHLRFTTVAAKNTPVLEGTLEYVSADRLTMDQRPGLSTAAMPTLVPNAFYTARVTIDSKELAKLGDLKIHTGMPVEVLINRGERTALQYIAGPISNNFARAFKER